MKTSNILMTTAVIIILGSLLLYDFGLRDEYQKINKIGVQEYQKTNRFNGYEKADITDFNAINFKAANNIIAKVEYGEKEAVWINKNAKGMVDVSQEGKKLIIDLSAKGKERNYSGYQASVIIISPEVKQIDAEAFGKVRKYKGKYGDSIVTTYQNNRCYISGFRYDSLLINLAANTYLQLDDNQLKALNATVGDKAGNGTLVINSDNNIDKVNLDVRGKSTVEVLDLDIKNIKYKISDGAVVTFRGTALSKLNKE